MYTFIYISISMLHFIQSLCLLYVCAAMTTTFSSGIDKVSLIRFFLSSLVQLWPSSFGITIYHHVSLLSLICLFHICIVVIV